MPYPIKKIVLSGILSALALALSLADRLIPLTSLIPLPGVKLGLANIVTLFSIYFLGIPITLAIVFVRCLLGSILGGSLTGFILSISGGLLALFVMALTKKARRLSLYGVSVAGAAAHNIGQVISASLLLGSGAVFSYLPVLLAVSVLTGGLVAAVSAPLFIAFKKISSEHYYN